VYNDAVNNIVDKLIYHEILQVKPEHLDLELEKWFHIRDFRRTLLVEKDGLDHLIFLIPLLKRYLTTGVLLRLK